MQSSTPADNRHIGRVLPAVCAAGLALLMAGCSSERSAVWRGLYESAKASVQKPPVVTLDQAAAIPYATLGVRVDGGQEGIAVLATDNSGQKLWASGKTVTLVTIDGRIQRTVGLAHNLSWSTIAGDPAGSNPLQRWKTPRRTSWTADYNETGQYSVQVSCDERPAGTETILILGQRIDTLRIDAQCSSPALNWRFTNVYWVGLSDGVLWRSIQYIHPKLGPIEMETLRPPG